MTPAPTTCADLPSRGNTAKALRAMICARDGWVLQSCAIRARIPGTCAALDDRANVDATVWHNPQSGAVCEPPAYDCATPEEPTAKGCHGCLHRLYRTVACTNPAPDVALWTNEHLSDDLLTPKPGAPECPGRVER